jgi:cation diffusion facilitator CzcD-associated flavoprotein CzcO
MGVEHVDVLIVGAGISGIGAACHLRRACPTRSFVILEGRDDIGGTWDLFRYPGVRSDSDMHTLGYRFKPWTAPQSIADGAAIMAYLRETVAEHDVARHIRFGHRVTSATWSSDDARWTVTASRTSDGTTATFTCGFLFMCSGYYSYRHGHAPSFPGQERFTGRIVHPQEWPDDLDHAGKRVVVIGSGATAMTLVPAMAETAAHVTMVQRSPTYVVARPDVDKLANGLRRVLPDELAHRATRWKNVKFQQFFYGRTRTRPDKVKAQLLRMVRKQVGDVCDVDTHFTPTYDPWDQRICLLPNGDLFAALRNGTASVVTDRIERFTDQGVELASGDEIPADIIVTATGLQLVTLGEMDFVVDGEPVDFAKTWTYKGLAYSDVPNLVSSFGYVNASWTLRADLTCAYVCRLLNHMAATGTAQCTPRLRPSDAGMPARPWIDGFTPGYMQRDLHRFPRQGDREPWVNPQHYGRDRKLLEQDPIDDGVMRFTTRRRVAERTS